MNILKNDLKKGFVFYPCCGTDFETVRSMMEIHQAKYHTYVLCDADRSLLPNKGFQGHEDLYLLEHKMGLAGLEILDSWHCHLKWFDNYESTRELMLALHGTGDYKEYLDGILFPSVVRYEVKVSGRYFVIYFFRIEALFCQELLFSLFTGNAPIPCLLVLKFPGGGWTETGSFQDLLIEGYVRHKNLPAVLATNQTHSYAEHYPIKGHEQAIGELLLRPVTTDKSHIKSLYDNYPELISGRINALFEDDLDNGPERFSYLFETMPEWFEPSDIALAIYKIYLRGI